MSVQDQHFLDSGPASRLEIGVIGGGLTGLALARRLIEQGHRVTVLEQAPQFGGLATHHDFGPFLWDRFYHVVLPTDQQLIRFLHEIGLGASLGWQNTQTGVFIDQQFHPMNNALDFIRFPPLSLSSKLRLGWMMHRAARIDDWRRLEQLTVEEWLCATCGRQTFERFWKPLLLAKLGQQYERVSAVFIWSYIKRLVSARHSAAKKEQLGYIAGGYKAVFDRLIELIAGRGGVARSGETVRCISAAEGDGVDVETGSDRLHFDKVVFTAPNSVLAKVASPELAVFDQPGAGVEYLGVVCPAIVSRRPLTPYYVLNIADARIPFTGLIGMSNVVPTSETAGLHLTYLPKYVSADDPLLAQSDEQIAESFLDGLQVMLPDYESAGVVGVHVNRAAKVQPLQVVGYSQKAPKCQTRHPDFYVLNTAQILFGTLNNNQVIAAVEEFADSFAAQWKTASASPPAVAAS